MSTKFDDQKPDLLDSTALSLVWREKTSSSAAAPADPTPETPAPAPVIAEPVPDIDGDENEYVPPSVIMMGGILRGIMNLRYAARPGDVEIHTYEDKDDGVYGFGFWPKMLAEEAMKEQTGESEPIDMYSDPDFYDSVQNFLTDFSEFCDGRTVEILFDSVGILAESKMDMLKALSDYISSPDYSLSTPDSGYLPDDNFDPQIADQQHRHRQALHIKAIRPDLDRQPRVRELGEFGPDPFFAVNNSPFSSMREFQQACYIASKLDIPFSLNHVYTTICQEDMLDPKDFDFITRGGQLTMGGYN